ncbi:MAG: dihydrofolate reductase [Leptolyngbya sp. SIO1D8]|nr:dihydrofolate reductase [Leptolyngbya sp. SIO1D8]
MKTIYYVASSLDGFIADIDKGVAWLDKLNIDQQATGCDSFFNTVDALLMGRKTYDFVYNYGQWPYENKPTWVCTSREIPRMDGCNLQSDREPGTAIQQAQRQGAATLWVVGGGQLVGALIKDRLLTHISISVMPILLGDGIPLVQSLPEHVYLRQESSQAMSGFTQIEYRVEA